MNANVYFEIIFIAQLQYVSQTFLLLSIFAHVGNLTLSVLLCGGGAIQTFTFSCCEIYIT